MCLGKSLFGTFEAFMEHLQKISFNIKTPKSVLKTFLFYEIFGRWTAKASKPQKCDFPKHILRIFRHL